MKRLITLLLARPLLPQVPSSSSISILDEPTCPELLRLKVRKVGGSEHSLKGHGLAIFISGDGWL